MAELIDLSRLPSPQIIEALDFESIFAAQLADLRARDPAFTALVESDPAYKILQVTSYRELLLRQRINEAARANLLAYATGADLEHPAALLGVKRLLLTPADPDAIPPKAAVFESDERLRRRAQLALTALSTAGPRQSYEYHALSVDASIKSVSVDSPAPGDVRVTVLTSIDTGMPSPALLSRVQAALNAENVRPLCDRVIVDAPTLRSYRIDATLVFQRGPDPTLVRALAEKALRHYVTSAHQLGQDIPLSAIYAALHQPGVARVTLATPLVDQIIGATEAPFCEAIVLRDGGIDG